jgi:ankyrin repeat protein
LFLALETHAEPPILRFLQWAWPASIQARIEKGHNPLHVAVIEGASHEVVDVHVPHEVVDLLVKWRQGKARERDDKGCLPIHYVMSWQDQWPNAAQVLVMAYPESLKQRSDEGEIPLYGAARSNSLPLVQFFVEGYPRGVRRRSNNGWLPLHHAVMCAEPWGEQVVPYLLQQWPASVRMKENHAVVGLGGPTLVNLLLSLEPSLLRVRATDGALALHDAAVEYEDLATVQTLIKLDPEAIQATLNNGWTPLHAAAKHDDGESAVAFARILLEHAPDLVRSRSVDGCLPIHCASRVGPLELVEFLDEYWPESLESVNEDGCTPLHLASMSQPPEVLRYLADRRPEALALPTFAGLVPLHFAARFQSSLPSVQFLVERRPDALMTKATGSFGDLPLHAAVARRDPPLEIVEYLADESPASLKVRDERGEIPVVLAARRGREAPLEVIFVLLRKWPEFVLPHPPPAAPPYQPTARQGEGID